MKTFITTTRIFKSVLPFLNYRYIKCSKMCNLSTVFVRQFEEEDTLKITFGYKYSDFPVHNFTFMRSKNEILETALIRMKNKIQTMNLQKASRKNKKAGVDIDQVLPPLNIVLMKSGIKVDENTKNFNAWTSDTEMIINNEIYKISVNPPSITHISLPKYIMPGFPVYPKVTFEFCSKEDSLFKWYQSISKKDVSPHDEHHVIKIKNNYWKFVSEGFIYIAQNSDVGQKLRISCIPQFQNISGMDEAAVSANCVVPSPGKCPFENRHQYTKELTEPGSLRFVSYNILADCYADTDTARNALFPYCPAEVLDVEYRKHLYLKEIMGYNADIVCLQEVDRRIFQEDLVPFLSTVNLKGIFNEKGGQVAEGLSCFYRDSKFKLIESHSILLKEAVKTEHMLQGLYSKICENEKLVERFLSRTTALQVTLLESLDEPKRRILVGNTHLYFHPNSDNIRLLQATCCILYLQDFLAKCQKEDPSYSVSLILSGDFNSCPEFGVYKLFTEGFLPSSCSDWSSNREETVDGMNLSHPLQLSSACGTPQYTNFTEGFVGCLDYIFYDKSLLEVTEVVPFPSHEQVIEYIALPNKLFPSDHIALVSTLSWK